MSSPREVIKVFCSYAREDEEWFKQLQNHLREPKLQERISLWDISRILGGTERDKIIKDQLDAARLILLLISSDFIGSDNCYEQMKRACERHQAKEAHVIPILVRDCNWQDLCIGKLNPLPTKGKPISKWKNVDKAWTDLVSELKKVLENISPPSPRASYTDLSNIPYGRNRLFTGRKERLERLSTLLNTSQLIAISGMAGIGKTQIAVEYVYRNYQSYDRVLWAQADTREVLISSFLTIAAQLNLPEKDVRESSYVIAAVKDWLGTHKNWLLILDNISDPGLADDFLPHIIGGHVLLTTYAQATGDTRRLEIPLLSIEEAVSFLLKRVQILTPDVPLEEIAEREQAYAIAICEELERHPLALDQAGAYVEETGCGLSGYLSCYRAERARYLKRRGNPVGGHPESVYTTFLLSFQQVEEQNRAAADLLRFCAYLAPDAIPERLITRGCIHPGSPLQEVARKPADLDEAIGVLRAYSLIQRKPTHEEDRVLSTHRLVQAVLQEQMDEQSKKEWAERVVRAVYLCLPSVERKNWSKWEQLIPHAQYCAQHIKDYRLYFREAAALLHQTGRYLHEHGRYTEAELFYRDSLDIQEQLLESDHPDVATSLSDLSNLYSEQGRYEEAEEFCKRVLDIIEQRLGRDHPKTASLFNNLAILAKVRGEPEKAEGWYKDSLLIWLRHEKTEGLKLAQSLNNLAVFYVEQRGKYETAERLLKYSLCIREQIPGADPSDAAPVINNLANLYTQWGSKYTEEDSPYQRSLYAEAKSLYERCKDILEQSKGFHHPELAYPCNGLGNLFYAQGEYEEAEMWYTRALSIWERHLEPEQPQVAYALHNLALLYTKQEKYEEAEEFYKRSLDIWDRCLSSRHLHTRTCAKNYVNLLRLLNKEDEAEELEKRYRVSD